MLLKAWRWLGKTIFFASIPFLHVYLRLHKRTRVLIVSEGRALLVKGWLGSGKWILPGGGRHNGESAIDGVIRELKEETGISLEHSLLKDLGEAKFARYGLRFTYQQFMTTLPKIIEPHLRQIEIVDAAWIPLENITDEIADTDVMRLIGVWKQSR